MPTRLFALVLLLFAAACSTGGGRFDTPMAAGRYVGEPMQCVPYARQQSGIAIRGDAHSWWPQAEGRYGRGSMPAPGAVLVLAATPRMRHGHVAVVRQVIDSRHIDVTHSNWGSDRKTRSMIYDRMRAEDVSPRNDWTSVRFWNMHTGAFGFPYAALGFIYR